MHVAFDSCITYLKVFTRLFSWENISDIESWQGPNNLGKLEMKK